MSHALCYFEILTADPEASQALLGELFGWTFTPSGEDYWMFQPAEGPGGGLQRADDVPERSPIQVYIRVASIDETLARAEQLGGLIETPRAEIGGGYGWYGLFRDPGGTVIGIWQPHA